ncbi:MAG: glycosyltransferase family 4 protein [Roseiarcus sp.]
MRLAVVTSHPIQYQAPLFRELATGLDSTVFFACRATSRDQANAGFGTAFEWDIDLTAGYASQFLTNHSRTPRPGQFSGCDTPEIGERLRGGRFDAVLVMGWHLKTYWQTIWAAKRLRIPVLARGDSHLETPRSNIKRIVKSLAYPPLLRLFDATLYVGRRSRSYYENYGYPAERLFFSPHCVDTAWFAARATPDARRSLRAMHGIAPQAKVLLFAGKLVPSKRPLDLIAAAAQSRAGGRNVEVMVAGDGELRSSMMKAAAAAGVPLHLLGFCNQTEMPAAYAAADCLVLPSDARETWGLVANEALACGRPIIVSNACGCAPDLASGTGAGLTHPVGDVQKLSVAILEIIDNPRQGDCIERTSERFNLKSAASGIADALNFVCANGAETGVGFAP